MNSNFNLINNNSEYDSDNMSLFSENKMFQFFDDKRQNVSLSDIDEKDFMSIDKEINTNIQMNNISNSSNSINNLKEEITDTSNKLSNSKLMKNKHLSIEEKLSLRRIKNKEYSKNSRARKKECIQLLIKENTNLKNQLYELKQKLNSTLCASCKEKLMSSNSKFAVNSNKTCCSSRNSHSSSERKDSINSSSFSNSNNSSDSCIVKEEKNDLNNETNKTLTSPNFGRKKIFATFVASFCIILNIISFSNWKSALLNKTNFNNVFNDNFRLLKEKDHYYLPAKTIESSFTNFGEYYISLGDFFSITSPSDFLNSNYDFKNNGGVRIIPQSNVYNYLNKTCTNCFTSIKANLQQKISKDLIFKLYLFEKLDLKGGSDKSEYYLSFNKSKGFNGLHFHEVSFKVLGVSTNSIKDNLEN